jgi:hypothetical protein
MVKGMKKLLVCGTQTKRKGYKEIVFGSLDRLIVKPKLIIEGCCPDSADVYAEEWARDNQVEIKHFAATKGTFLKRNIEMVMECDSVIAFWDGFSYGTAHTIATAVSHEIPVRIVRLWDSKEGK